MGLPPEMRPKRVFWSKMAKNRQKSRFFEKVRYASKGLFFPGSYEKFNAFPTKNPPKYIVFKMPPRPSQCVRFGGVLPWGPSDGPSGSRAPPLLDLAASSELPATKCEGAASSRREMF
jgi:hypothetical protein